MRPASNNLKHGPRPAAGDSIFWQRNWHWPVFLFVFALGAAVMLFVNYQFSLEDFLLWKNWSVWQRSSAPLVRVQIEFSPENKRAFEGEARAGMSVESALKRVASVAGIGLEIENEKITLLGNAASVGPKRSWVIYINGEAAPEALSRAVLAGDRIVLRYE